MIVWRIARQLSSFATLKSSNVKYMVNKLWWLFVVVMSCQCTFGAMQCSDESGHEPPSPGANVASWE